MILPSDISWYELLTLHADRLGARGLPADQVVTARLTYTGTERVWSERWAKTVGCWGRVRDVPAIAEIAGVEPTAVRQRAKSWDLKYATAREERTQADLALRCFFDRDRPAKRVRRSLGILEVERRWYCCAVQVICDENAWTPAELLRMDIREYQLAWAESGLVLAPPTDRFDIHDTAALRALIREVAKQ